MSPTNKKHHGKAKNTTTTPSRAPNAAPPLDAPSPAPTTCVAFREFIELANLESIKQFIATASSLPEGENIKLLWARAFKEGLTAGQVHYGKTKENLNKAHNSGYEEGFRDGSTSKIDLFQAGIEEGWCEEQGDWLIEGHGQHCGFQPTVICKDSSIQTEDPPSCPTATAAVQVDALDPPPPPHVEIQANVPRNTANSAVQTTPPRSIMTTAIQVDTPTI
jgi:hypothetical protein